MPYCERADRLPRRAALEKDAGRLPPVAARRPLGENEQVLRPPAPEVPGLVCSAKGCRRPASWALRWNNPKLHPPERRKTWLACPDHRDDLAGFLDLRGMLREVVPVEELERTAP